MEKAIVIIARLRVRYGRLVGSDPDEEVREEDWGEIEVAALPNHGDFIELAHDHSNQTVEVQYVQHFAVKHPLPETAFPSIQRTTPVTHIVAEWRDAD